jgi:hypothetical protein
MARNNWANEAFKKAQNLMSKGYDNFEPTSVVTKQDLNNLKTALLSDEQIASDNEQQPAQWYQFPSEDEQWGADAVNLGQNEHMGPQAKTTAYQGEDPIFGKDFDLDTIEQDAIDYEEKNAIRNKDPDRAQSDWDRWSAPDELTETEYKKKQSYLAIQAIQKEIEKTKYSSFTKLKPGERQARDARIEELKREQSRIMEKYRARDWSQGTPNEEVRKKYKQAEQYAVDNAPAAKELAKKTVEGGKTAWNEHKGKLDPSFVTMIEETIPGLVDGGKQIVNNIQDVVIPGIKKDWNSAVDAVSNMDFISEAGAASTGSVHNNPGNIENSSIKWNGQREGVGYGPNDRFASFETPEAGIRAMTMDITSKFKEFNGDLKKMIEKYAPSSENDVKKYLQVVQKTAGKKYRYTEKDIPNIVKGFIRMENKKELADYYIKLMEK